MPRPERSARLGAVVVPVALRAEMHELLVPSHARTHHELLAGTCARDGTVADELALAFRHALDDTRSRKSRATDEVHGQRQRTGTASLRV